MTRLCKVAKYLFLLTMGGLVYQAIELVFRGHTHPTMFLLGGICFVLCGLINEFMTWDMPMTRQMGICAIIITALEFVFGVVLNVWLGMGIWDYSGLPLNVMGQICLPYFFAWYFLSAAAIVLDDYLRHWFFGEEKPRYRIF